MDDLNGERLMTWRANRQLVEWPGQPLTLSRLRLASRPASSDNRRGFARWSKDDHHRASVKGGKGLVASGKRHVFSKGDAAREAGRLGGLERAKRAGQRIRKG